MNDSFPEKIGKDRSDLVSIARRAGFGSEFRDNVMTTQIGRKNRFEIQSLFLKCAGKRKISLFHRHFIKDTSCNFSSSLFWCVSLRGEIRFQTSKTVSRSSVR